MNTKSIIIAFLVGITLGIAGMILLPGYIRPYLPELIAGKETTVKGTVIAEQRKADSLLLTVNTAQGALLATIKRNVDEVDLLINVADEIEFTLKRYKPFISDPKVKRVLKKEPAATPGVEQVPPPVAEPKKETTPAVKPKAEKKSPPPSEPPKEADPGAKPRKQDEQPRPETGETKADSPGDEKQP